MPHSSSQNRIVTHIFHGGYEEAAQISRQIHPTLSSSPHSLSSPACTSGATRQNRRGEQVLHVADHIRHRRSKYTSGNHLCNTAASRCAHVAGIAQGGLERVTKILPPSSHRLNEEAADEDRGGETAWVIEDVGDVLGAIRASTSAAKLAANAGTAAAMNSDCVTTPRASMIPPINGPTIDPTRPMPIASRRRLNAPWSGNSLAASAIAAIWPPTKKNPADAMADAQAQSNDGKANQRYRDGCEKKGSRARGTRSGRSIAQRQGPGDAADLQHGADGRGLRPRRRDR